MITKGIITNINLLENTCTVRIPLFETAATKSQYISDGIIMTAPGLYNGYNVGDVVLVGFGARGASEPIVLGKLYLGVNQEKQKQGGVIQATDLHVSNTATLPASTTITFGNAANDTTVTNAENNAFKKYSSLKEVFSAVAINETNIASILADRLQLSEQAVQVGKWIDGKPLYQKVIIMTSATTMLANLHIETLWVDIGKSFLRSSSAPYTTEPIGAYTTIKKNDLADTFEITITENAKIPTENKPAYITVYYTINKI